MRRAPVPVMLTSIIASMTTFRCSGLIGMRKLSLGTVGALLAVGGVLDLLDQVRLHDHALVGQRRSRVRQLQQREAVVALADADRDRLARIPLLLEAPLLPRRRRQDAHLLALDVDAGDLAEAEGLHEVVDRVDAEVVGELVVIDVARLDDRLVHVDRTERHLVAVAEAVAAEHEEALVVDHLFGAALAELERSEREERLVGRADRVGAAQARG